MKVIVTIGKKDNRKTHLMLEILDKTAIEEIKRLIRSWKCREALSNIISKGRFVKELTEKEITQVASDLILTDTNAYWNLL
ncbi:MAG: hypothetical protein A2Z72_01920 [Omnitrophica bacterium RBG_13_46_9]|nr:MAG: hypothetical protein A2Z72_01920 [Omnitrophica bacterium RBG_13_46_9]